MVGIRRVSSNSFIASRGSNTVHGVSHLSDAQRVLLVESISTVTGFGNSVGADDRHCAGIALVQAVSGTLALLAVRLVGLVSGPGCVRDLAFVTLLCESRFGIPSRCFDVTHADGRYAASSSDITASNWPSSRFTSGVGAICALACIGNCKQILCHAYAIACPVLNVI